VRLWWLPLAALFVAPVTGAAAQESPLPTLGPHRFVPATRIEDPFLNGYVQTTVALGAAANTSTPTFTLPDSTVVQAAPAENFYFSLGFAYQHRMKDWLAVVAGLEAAGRLGSNTRSLIADGITGNVGYRMGWKIRAVETTSFLLSGSVGLTNDATSLINILKWANDLVDGSGSDLVRSASSLRGRLGLHAAWAIDERFALLGTGLADYGESIEDEEANEWLGDLRFAVSYNLEQDLKVPLGLAATVGYSSVQVRDTTGIWFWRTRIAVQSREDFSIGIDFGTSYYESLQRNANTQFSELSIDTRYYF
jgi:hypothetical protein